MGEGVETAGGGDTFMQGLAPWGWELKLQVVGTLRHDVTSMLHCNGTNTVMVKMEGLTSKSGKV